MPLHVSSTRAYRQEAKIVLYNLWYHHTYRWPSCAQVERGLSSLCYHHTRPVHRLREDYHHSGIITPIGVMIPEVV